MICSFLIPSRARYDRLKKSIESIRAHSHDSEILVRLDHCDPGSIEFLMENPDVKTLIGSRDFGEYYGYKAVHLMYTELALAASAPWIWVWNDDSFLDVGEGFDWEAQLAGIEPKETIVHPEWYQLHQSFYQHCDSGFPLIPNGSWEGPMDVPIDTWMIERAKKLGWGRTWLGGVTVNHQRDSEQELLEHRDGVL